ncbi:MAG TPA: hypothetical protein PLA12_10855 [Candidatus Hydrogenedens sp.]|nr:hypothetical protein [Candidatus Hydrogenedens sp.]
MLKILIISDSILAEPIVSELEALGHEVTHLNNIDYAKEHIFHNHYDILLLDYKEALKLSNEEVFEIRYFSHIPYELPIYVLTENDKNKINIEKKIIYSGVFPYTHSLNMINEFITHFQPLNTYD